MKEFRFHSKNNFLIAGRVVPPIETNDMLLVFKKALNEVALGQKLLQAKSKITEERDLSALNRALIISLHLACLLSRLIDDESCTKQIRQEILCSLFELVNLKVNFE